MKLVIGLGNPGPDYEDTRHNVGWWVVNHLADVWRFPAWRDAERARVCDGDVHGRRVRLLKPLTFMNLSGDALAPYANRPFWAAANDLLVVVDDVALPLGTFRFRAKGSAGGHNGLRSIEHALGTQDYPRLRIGVGAGEQIAGDVLRAFVLANFSRDDATVVVNLFPALKAGIETFISDGILAAMNRHPGRSASPAPPQDESVPPIRRDQPTAAEPRAPGESGGDRPAS